MFIPREHGAWGLLLVPLFTGVIAGFASEHRIWFLFLFTCAALSLFSLRTPVESLLGTSPIAARTTEERRTALAAACGFFLLAAVCLTALLWRKQFPSLFLIGEAVGAAFFLQVLLRRLGRGTRTISQMAGAIGLTATAPCTYYIGSGHLDAAAFALWIANWMFACNQIQFVQLRIHAARATGFEAKLSAGRSFLLAQIATLACLFAAAVCHILPRLALVAFVPVIFRSSSWFFRKPEPLDVRKLGWSEMKQGVAFGLLLGFAFVYRP